MELHPPLIELTILIPLIGAIWVGRLRDVEVAKGHSLVFASLALACTLGTWLDFVSPQTLGAQDRWDSVSRLFGPNALVIDELSAPLLPLVALLYLMTAVATLRTKMRRFSFSWTLASEAMLLAILSCREPWLLVALLAAHTVPPYFELRARRKPTRVYVLHMASFIVMLVAGWAIVESEGDGPIHSMLASWLLIAAVLLRNGIVPVHCWMTDLFEHGTFGTALLFVTPMVGAYATVRLVLPIAPEWALHSIALISLLTALYAAGMALVQRDARRFFCYLLLSHSSLVLVGLEIATPLGLTGALSLWLSIGLSLTGFGLTLRSIEARLGRLSLADFHGLYEHTPTLAVFFLLTGLASVGFPGTIGFIGTELLIDGAMLVYPQVGIAVVIAAALNGIAVLQAYFRLFTGTRRITSISLRIRWPERLAVVILAVLILGGGLFPQPGIASRHHAAMEIVRQRAAIFPAAEQAHDGRRVEP